MSELVKQTDENRIGAGKAGPGRPKGSVNKTTAQMKDAIAAVYADLQQYRRDEDGSDNEHAHFLEWAKDNDTEFYKLAAKLIPIVVGGDAENPLKHIHEIALVPVAANHDA